MSAATGPKAPKKIGVHILKVFKRVRLNVLPEKTLPVGNPNSLEIEFPGDPAIDPPHRIGGLEFGGSGWQIIGTFAYFYELNIRTCDNSLLRTEPTNNLIE